MFEHLLNVVGDDDPSFDPDITPDVPVSEGDVGAVGFGTEDKTACSDLGFSGMEHFRSQPLLANQARNEDEIPGGVYQGAPNSDQLPYCPVFILKDPAGNTCYTAKITGEIRELSHYLNLLVALEQAQANDTIIIYIASPGGLVFTGTAISSAIALCKGKVVTVARGMCASAGSLIWSAGHECRVEPFALFMYHMSSHMDGGNSGSVRDKANGIVEYVKRALRLAAVAKGHLTEEEFTTLTEMGENVYIDAKTMAARLGRTT